MSLFSDAYAEWKRFVREPLLDRVDWRYGSDTGGTIQMSDLAVASVNAQFATCYRGTLGWVIRRFVRALPIDPAGFTFVDFGSGKGRALLVASEYPFRRIVGLEFCEALHRIAERNIALLPEARRRDGRVVSLLQDATAFNPPPENLVAYLYNPFGPPILDKIVDMVRAHRARGHEVYVIYINPVHRAVLEAGGFECVFSHKKGLIYRALPAGR